MEHKLRIIPNLLTRIREEQGPIHTEGEWEYGITFKITEVQEVTGEWTETERTSGKWMRLTEEAYDKICWFVKTPLQICELLGIQTTAQRAKEFYDFIDGDLGPWYYLNFASQSTLPSDEAIKVIMGPFATVMKEHELSFRQIGSVINADQLNHILLLSTTNKLQKQHFKEIFDRMINGEILEVVLKDPRYCPPNAVELDSIIEKVILDNQGQFEKAKTDPKLVNWFVGQIMKETKGKASAPLVMQKVKERLQ